MRAARRETTQQHTRRPRKAKWGVTYRTAPDFGGSRIRAILAHRDVVVWDVPKPWCERSVPIHRKARVFGSPHNALQGKRHANFQNFGRFDMCRQAVAGGASPSIGQKVSRELPVARRSPGRWPIVATFRADSSKYRQTFGAVLIVAPHVALLLPPK